MRSSTHLLHQVAHTAISLWQKQKLLLLAMSLFSFLDPVFSQSSPTRITVSGTVKDSAGAGLAGVTVSERGRSNAVTTAGDGSFSIAVTSDKSVLVFSSVGYTNQ